MKEKITVIGAGSWGTAIANLLAYNQHDVCAISDIKEISEEINQKNTHKSALPEINLEKNLKCSLDLKENAKNSDLIYIVVPSNVVPIIIGQLQSVELKENCGFVICTKGLDHKSLKLFHQIIEEKLPKQDIAVLSGPNFAIEVAQKVPSVTNIASLNEEFATRVISAMQNDFFKPIFLPNILIAEVSSVVKNIMAIACGINDGLGFGENSKAALIVQGVMEIKTLAKAIEAENDNNSADSRDCSESKCTKQFAVDNAAGFGDIFLTCSTTKSRNNSLGSKIGQGEKYSDLKKIRTYEGALNADSVSRLAKKLDVKLKLCQAVHEILEKEPSVEEIERKVTEIVCG